MPQKIPEKLEGVFALLSPFLCFVFCLLTGLFHEFLSLQFFKVTQTILMITVYTLEPRSDLKTPYHFNFSSFFGDFCFKVYDRVIQISKE